MGVCGRYLQRSRILGSNEKNLRKDEVSKVKSQTINPEQEQKTIRRTITHKPKAKTKHKTGTLAVLEQDYLSVTLRWNRIYTTF